MFHKHFTNTKCLFFRYDSTDYNPISEQTSWLQGVQTENDFYPKLTDRRWVLFVYKSRELFEHFSLSAHHVLYLFCQFYPVLVFFSIDFHTKGPATIKSTVVKIRAKFKLNPSYSLFTYFCRRFVYFFLSFVMLYLSRNVSRQILIFISNLNWDEVAGFINFTGLIKFSLDFLLFPKANVLLKISIVLF